MSSPRNRLEPGLRRRAQRSSGSYVSACHESIWSLTLDRRACCHPPTDRKQRPARRFASTKADVSVHLAVAPALDESELPAPTTPIRLLRPGESERLRSVRPGDRASS